MYQEGVPPLASSRSTSAGADWRDVAGNLVAFEAINGVRLEIRISTADYHGRADLRVVVVAHPADGQTGEVTPSGSVSVTCSGTRLRTMEGALIHALYLMDGQLAATELLGKDETA
jgi:hypothetical protein